MILSFSFFLYLICLFFLHPVQNLRNLGASNGASAYVGLDLPQDLTCLGVSSSNTFPPIAPLWEALRNIEKVQHTYQFAHLCSCQARVVVAQRPQRIVAILSCCDPCLNSLQPACRRGRSSHFSENHKGCVENLLLEVTSGKQGMLNV